MGRPRASQLTPLLRSEAAGRVLAAILLSPESIHVRAISDLAQVPYSVAQREVDRFERAGLVASQRFATARVVRANENHPLYNEIRTLLLKAYGPRDVLEQLLREEPSIQSAYIYGSWAARYEGEPGPAPADIDVLLVGDVPPRRREELEAAAEGVLGIPVQIEVMPAEEWKTATRGFTQTLRSRPLVPIRER